MEGTAHHRFLNIARFVIILVIALIALELGYLKISPYLQVIIVVALSLIGSMILTSLQGFTQYLLENTKKNRAKLIKFESLNFPLMERLSKEAPGTYSHSLMVAQLAVSVGKNLNLDPVLLRIAAYYHDIGKLKSPNTFIENKKNSPGPSEDPTEKDAHTIVDHVAVGVKIARENGLPEEVIDLISQHHGTSTFFNVSYLGPKPLSRYSAILMLSDGIEARIRASKKTTDEVIDKIVRDEIEKRLKSDQLHLSGYSSYDLARIEKTFVQSARSVFHKRGSAK